jgi:thiol-disulfide isomerase/thioredoxin
MFLPITQSVEEATEPTDAIVNYLNEQDITVIKYEAKWCEVCRDIEPLLNQFSDLHPDIPMLKIDIDEMPHMKHWARIKALPMVIMYRNGKMREFVYGKAELEKYEQKLQRALR